MPEKEQDAQQEVQQKLVLYQMLGQRLEQINEQARVLEQRMLELETTRQALDDLKGLKEGNEVLIPLGSGCYTYGKTVDSKNLLCDLGAGIMINKSPQEAKGVLDGKKTEIDRLSETLQGEAKNTVEKMNELGPELQEFLQKSQGRAPEKEAPGVE